MNIINRLELGRDWKINLVDNIDERDIETTCPFSSLPKNRLYSLYIDCDSDKERSRRVESLSYGQLKSEIARSLLMPSSSFIKIFIAPYRKNTRGMGE